MRPLIPAILLCLFCSACAQSHENKVAPASIAKTYGNRMRDSLPEGWSIGWHDNILWIRRVGMITVGTALSNASAPELSATQPAASEPVAPARAARVTVVPLSSWTRQFPYVLALTFYAPLTAAEYERRAAVNAEREKKLDEYRHQLLGVTHKFDDYDPVTPQEKALVSRYRHAQKTLPYYDLPAFLAKDCSVEIVDSVSADAHGFNYIADPEIAADCRQVKQIVEGFFTKAAEPAATQDK